MLDYCIRDLTMQFMDDYDINQNNVVYSTGQVFYFNKTYSVLIT